MKIMKAFIVFFCLLNSLLILHTDLSAQKVVQIERRNSPETIKYYSGDIFIYKVKEDKDWHISEIIDVYVDRGLILLDSGILDISDISYLQAERVRKTTEVLFNSFGTFGLTILTYTLIDLAYSSSYNWLAFYAGVSGIALAITVRYIAPDIFKKKIGKTYQVRLLDLSYYDPIPDMRD